MNAIREHIYLAALLHDIGKFYQRADTGSETSSRYLGRVVIEGKSMILPLLKGDYTHKHGLWTAQFIDDYRSVFQSLVNADLCNLTQKDNLYFLAAGHHLPLEQQTELGKIIKKADCLSSGMDRNNDEAMKDDQDEKSWDAFKKKRMTSILQDINGRKGESVFHLPLMPLCLRKEYFPDTDKEIIPDYITLWGRFNADFKQIQANTYHAFSETLLSLLFKYTTTIPSSTINFPDVSLYDHLKTTAAIAICLYDYEQSTSKGDTPFLLIGGDFSGIQNYIYQIISKHAAKNLKGRSFYLRILSDSIVRYLLKVLRLFQANVIYNSGGSFYLLAPNTGEVKRILEQSVRKIEEHLFRMHTTTLFVAIDSVEVTEDMLMHRKGENLRNAWTQLFEKREVKKRSKFSSLMESEYGNFFIPAGGERLHDSITGEEFLKEELCSKNSIDEEDGNRLTLRGITSKQIDLGRMLRESDVMVVSDGEIPYWKDKVSIAPANLGIYYYLLKFADVTKMKDLLRASADKVSVVSLNGGGSLDCDFMKSINGLNNIYALEFYGGNKFSGKTFEEMCKNDSFSRLGVLRMDVDNLGSLFQSGIREDRATLSRYAALSRSLDYFFSGYLNKIQQEIDEENTFIVYSGGDDVFIVGVWDKMIEMAERIRNDFREFTCENPSFSISGGIAIVPKKFPIMKGAEVSAEEEKNAKGHKVMKVQTDGTQMELTKNSLSFMGTPLNWDKEYPIVKRLKNKIVNFVEQKELPKSFISKLLGHALNADIKGHTITNFKTYWMLTYDLSRMKSTRQVSTCRDLINNCIKEVCSRNCRTLNGESIITHYNSLELWTFAARWAELEIRTNSNNS
ncbi:type III-A CRISPR-associated protein Cas10/Csm1 [Bacteroides sp. UBA939]|uniref:type III-A CRISPR-associated protein Cas10/Csm1 n=1 Tax=Bacteroides sp. UBA939 TaxID=1946092 RepID=UPI0025B990D6|nr:type III-A CRISPR-associated protein Cas10/Csm1 [Bacteroides sp. UBA939]